MAKSVNKRVQSCYHISITFPDNKVISKTEIPLYKLLEVYFINLDNNLKGKGYKIDDAEELMQKYEKLFENCKVIIQYTDSWGHRWKGKCAWPKREKFINYLKERIVNYGT